MGIRRKAAMGSLVCTLAFWASASLAEPPQDGASDARDIKHRASVHRKERPLSSREGSTVVAVAMHTQTRRSEHDCSHLVHGIYERAGFPYSYADSDDLYSGVQGFLRVNHPQPGDLIVWHGHAGIVVRPSRHLFFSFLSRGPGMDNYESRYWAGRGRPRFYRYIKNDPCPGCRPS